MLKRSKQASAASQRLGYCINLVRFITESEHFQGAKVVGILEESLKPILRYAADPSVIDFDDDLVFCIDALVRKQKAASPILQEVYPHLPKFQEKNKGLLANLVSCLNAYIIYAPDFIAASE